MVPTSRPRTRQNVHDMKSTGRYRIVQRLGVGSFATVWLGHDDELDVPVAIKVLAENWAANADVRKRFFSEARMLRKIRDPRVVQVYDIGTLDDDRPFFVMDYADAGSLEDLRRNRIPASQVLRLCAEAARALQVLHDNQIVHRDVTPGNLLLSTRAQGDLQVLLADLGVAKSMIGDLGMTMTAGTPAYMAPEQAKGIVLDHRADVYAIGAVTHALLTGRPPFQVRTVADAIQRSADETPPPVAELIGAPRELDTVLASALATQPGRRPHTAADFADALDRVTDQMSGTGAPIQIPTAEANATVLRPSASSMIGSGTWESAPNMDHAHFTAYPQSTIEPGWQSMQPVPPSAPPGPPPVSGPPPMSPVPRHDPMAKVWLGLAAIVVLLFIMFLIAAFS